MTREELLRALKALDNELRLDLLWVLDEEPTSVGVLAQLTDVRPSVCSTHLQHLLRENLVVKVRSGPYALYALNGQKVLDVAEELKTLTERNRT